MDLFILLSQDVALYSLKGSTAANLSHLLQEKEKIISSLNKTLEEKEKDKLAQQEELAELRRLAIMRDYRYLHVL